METTRSRGALRTVLSWFDTEVLPDASELTYKYDWLRMIPFFAVHVACLAVFWVGFSWVAFAVAVGFYLVRMFAITGFYHRYFSHRSFKSTRFMQFLFGALGCTAVQRGPLWWAAHHRWHHRFSDTENDPHTPVLHGFWWSHMGWFGAKANFVTKYDLIKDLAKYPELRFLNRYDLILPVAAGVFMFGLGVLLQTVAPSWGTSGWQMLVWGFFLSTVACWHGTYTINSLCHIFGKRRFKTQDQSRNNWLLAMITLGEGWHNNHHRFPASCRQGFVWWEIDMTYYVLKAMSWFGLVWDLRPVPAKIMAERNRAL